ncbi:MAG: BofC C-terminal domain-containing protein [Clostridia bacterium]|nr:BofC C-terminal domain-containing protein [Clostridia bacterium]
MGKLNKMIIAMIIIIAVLLAILSAVIIYSPTKQESAKTEKKIETKVSDETILDECTDEYNEIEEEIISTNSEQEKISPNCKIILKKYYKKCKDEINEYIKVPDNLVNATEEKLQNYYKDWEIKEFSSNQIILYKEFEGGCGEHYILKDEEGKVVIYKISEKGEEVLYEKTEISTDYLPEKDKNAIQQGLKINVKEKLNELIESYE